MQWSFMPPCLGTYCSLGRPLPLLTRHVLDLLWDQLKTQLFCEATPVCVGGSSASLSCCLSRGKGIMAMATKSCCCAWSQRVAPTFAPCLACGLVRVKPGTNIFTRKSGRFAKMSKWAHPLTATLRKLFHSFIHSTPVYRAFILFKVVFSALGVHQGLKWIEILVKTRALRFSDTSKGWCTSPNEVCPRNERLVDIWKSINTIQRWNRIKEKSQMIVSVDAEKAFDKTEYPFLKKALTKLGIGRNSSPCKGVYNKSTANTLSVARLLAFLRKISNKKRHLPLPLESLWY